MGTSTDTDKDYQRNRLINTIYTCLLQLTTLHFLKGSHNLKGLISMKRVSEGKDTYISPLWKNTVRFIGISKWTNNTVISEGSLLRNSLGGGLHLSEYITYNVLKK